MLEEAPFPQMVGNSAIIFNKLSMESSITKHKHLEMLSQTIIKSLDWTRNSKIWNILDIYFFLLTS